MCDYSLHHVASRRAKVGDKLVTTELAKSSTRGFAAVGEHGAKLVIHDGPPKVAVCLLPEMLRAWANVPFYFGGTSLLIVVVVVMDFIAQIQAHLMSHQYEGLMKKANLKGGPRGGLARG